MESPTAFYNDYEALWSKAYRKKEYVWKKMCCLLENYHKTADKILSINTDVVKDKESYIKYRFLVPSIAYNGVSKIISSMIENEIFGKNSEVYYYTADSCEVNIYAHSSIGDKIKFLMSDPYVLSQADNIDIFKTPHFINLSFDYLTVYELDLREVGKLGEKIKELLKLLEKEFAFIVGYTESGEDDQLISFTYATKRIKKLLTNAGNILEIYVYHKCLKSDLFDDIATGYEISWDKTAVKSEFDIIVTKGFAGLLIEAKAKEDIDQEHYFKLSCLAKEFGTNCRAVLIADMVEKWYNDNSNNEMQRLRGNMLDVITISDPREIDEIDVTLARLLNIEVRSVPRIQAQSRRSAEAVQMTREEFLSQKITVLGIEQSLIAILQNNGVQTIEDLIEQTEETFSRMKAKNGMTYTEMYMNLQEKMKKKLNNYN